MSDTFAAIQNHFQAALEWDDLTDQLRYVNDQCGENPELQAELQMLLRAHHESGDFLNSNSGNVADVASVAYEPLQEKVGSVIGPYKLREQIGEGGMGIVFVAEQTEPVRRKVALKLIKPGMDTKQVIARFEAERQTLALMDHPNIAKFIDAGVTGETRTSSGEPEGVSPRRPPVARTS